MTDVVFVHGALVRDGEWWWRPTAELLLDRHGLRSRSVPLVTTGDAGIARGDLHDDADALRAVLDEVEGGAIVVGHSYGGTVIADAGPHPGVRHVVLISSYLPDPGDVQGALLADEPDPVEVAPRDDGTMAVSGYDLARFAMRFLQDGDARMQQEAWSRVAPQALGAFLTPVRAPSGTADVDSTYLVCTDDRSTTVALQRRHASRATRSIDVSTGHHPFLTRPDLVAEVVAELAAGAT